jgi:hypothetical protein
MNKYLSSSNQFDQQRSTLSSSIPSVSSQHLPHGQTPFAFSLPSPKKTSLISSLCFWQYFTPPAQSSSKPFQKPSPTKPFPTPHTWFQSKKVHPSFPSPSTPAPPSPVTLADLTQDSHVIRQKILLDIPLEFLSKTLLILYGPPRSSVCQELASFLANKFQFVILESAHYHPFASSHVPPPHPPPLDAQAHCAISQDQPLEQFESRIKQEDCAKGFIFLNFPQTALDLNLLQSLTPDFRKVVLLIDQDFTVSSSLSPPLSLPLLSFPLLLPLLLTLPLSPSRPILSLPPSLN